MRNFEKIISNLNLTNRGGEAHEHLLLQVKYGGWFEFWRKWRGVVVILSFLMHIPYMQLLENNLRIINLCLEH